MKLLWLRSEDKAFEKRCSLSPSDAKKLVDAGVKVCVEKSPMRIFEEGLYQAVGCEIVEEYSWYQAPDEAIILGLKELKEQDLPLKHKHIYFAHCYKGQSGAEKTLKRFKDGAGTLFDLEYLTDEHKRRVAAFGYYAGFVGAGLGLDILSSVNNHGSDETLSNYKIEPKFYSNKEQFIDYLKQKSISAKVLIIGAKGRSGSGAVDLCQSLGLEPTKWDIEETKKGGPFEEILEHDLLINCVFINKKIPPFIDKNTLAKNGLLKVISDVSCDPTGDHNPLPIYDQITTFDKPLFKVKNDQHDVLLQAIDHLPSMLPKESSEEFSSDLIPHLIDLFNGGSSVWDGAEKIFREKLNL